MDAVGQGGLRLDELPTDVLREIFVYLTPYQQAKLALMCRAFRMALQGSEFKALNSLRLEHLLSKYRAAPGWLCLVTQHWQIDRSDLLIVLDILRALQEKKPRQLKLQSIAIAPRAKLKPKDFHKLVRLKALRALNIHAAELPADELLGLTALAQLQELTLDGLKAASLPPLSLSSLRSLQVLGARRLADVSGVSHCTGLEELVLSGCVRLEGVRLTGMLPHLTRLSLYGCTLITDAELVYLTEAPNLQEIDVTGCVGLSGVGFRAVHKLPLQIICAGECPRLSAEGLRAIAAFPLVELDIQAMEYAPTELLGDRHLSSLGALTGLEALNLANRVSSHVAASLAFLSQLTHLESIDLSCATLSVQHLLYFARLPRLRSVNVSRSRTFSDECLKVVSQFTALERLNIVGCPRVTTKGLAQLQFMHSLRRLKVQSNPALGAAWFARMLPHVRVEMYGSAVATFRVQQPRDQAAEDLEDMDGDADEEHDQ